MISYHAQGGQPGFPQGDGPQTLRKSVLVAFGRRLRCVAAVRRLTQAELSRRITRQTGKEVSRGLIWTWFDGRAEPTFADLYVLSHELDIPLDWLILGKTECLSDRDRDILETESRRYDV